MTCVAILGAGAGGCAAAVELSLAGGHKVRIWNKSPETLRPIREAGAIGYEGVFGRGRVVPEMISDDLDEVVKGVDGILVCMPTFAHGSIAKQLAERGLNGVPIVLNPGHTGGALEVRHVFREFGCNAPSIVEFSTLTYVVRKADPITVNITGRAKQVKAAVLGEDRSAFDLASEWFASAAEVGDVLATSLSNVNLILHPPCAILGAAWIEATGGDFTFYVEGMTEGVSQVMQRLDAERRHVAAEFGHELSSLIDEMRAIGTVEQDTVDLNFADCIRTGKANKTIRAPDSLLHRYYVEDFWYGLKPFLALAEAVSVEVPVAKSLMELGNAVHAPGSKRPFGRSAQDMGIEGMGRDEIIRSVRTSSR